MKVIAKRITYWCLVRNLEPTNHVQLICVVFSRHCSTFLSFSSLHVLHFYFLFPAHILFHSVLYLFRSFCLSFIVLFLLFLFLSLYLIVSFLFLFLFFGFFFVFCFSSSSSFWRFLFSILIFISFLLFPISCIPFIHSLPDSSIPRGMFCLWLFVLGKRQVTCCFILFLTVALPGVCFAFDFLSLADAELLALSFWIYSLLFYSLPDNSTPRGMFCLWLFVLGRRRVTRSVILDLLCFSSSF